MPKKYYLCIEMGWKGLISRMSDECLITLETVFSYCYDCQAVMRKFTLADQAQLLPPQAVKYVCEDYCIDLPPELQDQRVLQSHQLYQKVVRELQLTTFFDGKWTKITEIPPDF